MSDNYQQRLLRCKQGPGPIVLVGGILLAGLMAADSWGAAWVADSEGTETRWQADSERGPAKLVKHEQVRTPTGVAGSDRGSELITYLHPPGMACWFWTGLPPAAVIEDLKISVALKANGPGAQVAIEAVLPRINDPRTGEALRLVIRAPNHSPAPPGETTLTLSGLPSLLKQRLRAELLRRRHEGDLDSTDDREAYVTRIALIAPGDVRARSMWVHEIRIDGLATPLGFAAQAEPQQPLASTKPQESGQLSPSEVDLNSDGFVIDRRPFFPRMWTWRGEAMDDLTDRGFNTLLLDQSPTVETLREAAASGLRVIAPPPQVASIDPLHGATDPVIAWVLDAEGDPRRLDTLLAEVERVRSLPVWAQRPLLIRVATSSGFGRMADGLLIDTQASLHEGAEGVIRQARAALASAPPGTPWIALLGAEAPRSVQSQLDALLGEAAVAGWLSPGDLSDATHAVVTLGCRGVAYTSLNGLEGADTATRLTNLWFVVINSHLRLIEPWLVGHNTPSMLRANRLTLFDHQGVRLALTPILNSSLQSGVVLPGVADSAYVFRLTSSGLHSARSKRIAGGLSIETSETSGRSSLPGAYVLSNDPRVATSLRRYTLERGRQAAATWVLAAREAIQQTEALDPNNQTNARSHLESANLATARRDYATALDEAHAALSIVDHGERERRRIATELGGLIQSSPLAVLPATLTDHFRLAQLMDAGARGQNRLFGGSFEDLDQVRSYGWRRKDVGEGDFDINLAAGTPINGDNRLRITCREPHRAGSLAPRIVSPEIELRAGELVEVVGWARVESLGLEPVGQLRIEDNLGGRGLSLAIGPTETWRPFRLIRRARESTAIRVELAVEGAAAADVDGLMVRSIDLRPTTEVAGRSAQAK